MHLSKMITALTLALVASFSTVVGQTETPLMNQTDDRGFKQGFWEEIENRIVSRGFYTDSQRDGTWTTYHPQGVISEITSYRMGKKDGQHVVVDRRGFLQADETFRNNLLHGLSTNYVNGSRKLSEIEYFQGVEHGFKKMYYDNSKLQEQSFYKNGKRDGKSSWYDQKGNVVAEYEYTAGQFNGEHRTYYPNGKLYIQQHYNMGTLQGTFEEFYDDGKPKLTGEIINGLKEGKWLEYDVEGKVKTLKYKNNELK